jgi:hypothetical protein
VSLTTAERPETIRTTRDTLLEHVPFLIAATGYVAIGGFVLRSLDRPIPLKFGAAYTIPVLFTCVYLCGTLLTGVLKDIVMARRAPFDAGTWRLVIRRWLPPRRMLGVLLVLAALPALLAIMLGFRTALTDFGPFRWDPAFMRADAWLHLGRQPWELLQPVIGYPTVTRFLDEFYVYGWFFFLWIGVTWQTVHGREPIRSQFLLTFALTWIVLGTLGGIAFASAGPVYFGRVTGLADPYAPLMAYLQQVDSEAPLRALAVQEKLWADFMEWGGITAMPSMHLAQTTVVVLAAVRTRPGLAFFAIPVLGLILLGSVHLGWHYAVDSYAGIAGACVIWWVAGRLVALWSRASSPRPGAAE